jgi:hypothetical protein
VKMQSGFLQRLSLLGHVLGHEFSLAMRNGSLVTLKRAQGKARIGRKQPETRRVRQQQERRFRAQRPCRGR